MAGELDTTEYVNSVQPETRLDLGARECARSNWRQDLGRGGGGGGGGGRHYRVCSVKLDLGAREYAVSNRRLDLAASGA